MAKAADKRQLRDLRKINQQQMQSCQLNSVKADSNEGRIRILQKFCSVETSKGEGTSTGLQRAQLEKNSS